MSTCHKRHQKSHFIWNFTGQLPRNTDTHFARACAVEMHVHMSQESSEEPRYQLYTEIHRKLPRPRLRTHTLCEPAQSKRMSTLHKSHSIRQFAGKNASDQNCAANFVRACAVETHVKISQEPLYTEIYR